MKAIPTIQKFMTTTPHSINYEAPLEEAIKLMEKNKFRHLPVIKNGEAFGLLSDRDVKNLLTFAGTNPKTTKVGDVCGDEPYVTKPQAPINDVAAIMAEKKYGSALVMDNGKLVGIFTLTDACKALAEIVEQRFHN
jgi:acetoin utilization protein AcuB